MNNNKKSGQQTYTNKKLLHQVTTNHIYRKTVEKIQTTARRINGKMMMAFCQRAKLICGDNWLRIRSRPFQPDMQLLEQLQQENDTDQYTGNQETTEINNEDAKEQLITLGM